MAIQKRAGSASESTSLDSEATVPTLALPTDEPSSSAGNSQLLTSEDLTGIALVVTGTAGIVVMSAGSVACGRMVWRGRQRMSPEVAQRVCGDVTRVLSREVRGHTSDR